MRDLFIKFRKSEDGASLVEYAVALIVVTIVGGAGVIALGQNAGTLAEGGCDVAGSAAVIAQAATTGTNTGTVVADC
ncbi:MAG: hypothetical protein RIE24_20280 [Silicimonas sp.]